MTEISSLFTAGTLLSIGGLGLYLFHSDNQIQDETNMEEPITEEYVMEEPVIEEKHKKGKTRANRKRQRGITRRRY
jgi:hypothetical protein